jgi:hypothetical protein
LFHLLFRRSLELRDKGSGFDAPGTKARKQGYGAGPDDPKPVTLTHLPPGLGGE